MKLALAALLVPVALMAQTGPAEARGAFDEAQRAAQQNRTADAILGYQRAVSLDPRFAEAWFRLGELQLNSHDREAARKSLEAAIEADPDYAPPYALLATLQHDAGDWKGLLASTDRLIAIDPGANRLNYLYNAVANYNLRHPEAAERSIREAIRLDPGHQYPESLRLLGEMLFQRGDYAGAAEQFRACLRFAKPGPEMDAVLARLSEMEKRPEARDGTTFRSDTDLALVRFQFVPPANQPAADLRPEDIEIKEDGVPRKIAVFEGGRFYPRRVPLEITLLFDCSGSIRAAGALQPRVFETTLLNDYENVTIAVYAFSHDLLRITTPTRYAPALVNAMNTVPRVPAGNTPLFASIAETARQAAANGGAAVRMMVIFSDGQADYDDVGRFEDAVGAAQELGIALYPVLLRSRSADLDDIGSGIPAFVWESMDKYRDLGNRTGGVSFTVLATGGVLPAILGAIAQHIRYDYVAGFYPPASGATRKRHTVEVSLRSGRKGKLTGGKRLLEH
ncbi:MAG: tetratricopeptide repeat protein [Bryobacteraceae bacterium]|jgi:VWFA-related protein